MHKFWSTQPVSHRRREQKRPGIINNSCPYRPHPLTLPKQFSWVEITIDDLHELTEFINNHYVEDSGHRFRFRYTEDVVSALCFDPRTKHYCFGVRYQPTGRLCAFIMGMVHNVCIVNESENEFQMVFVDFLTIHTKLRNKRLSPVMIQELTRRVNNDGIILAYYSIMFQPSVPIATTEFFIYPLNLEKLVMAGYWKQPPPGIKLSSLIRTYRELPSSSVDWKPSNDAKGLADSLNKWTEENNHHLYRVITENDIRRWQKAGFKLYESSLGKIGYYILENQSLSDSSVVLKEVFILYIVGQQVVSLLGELLNLASNEDADVVIAVEQSVITSKALVDARFKPSSETTNWFLYNYHHSQLVPRELFLPTP